MASATTATPSPAARRSGAGPLAMKREAARTGRQAGRPASATLDELLARLEGAEQRDRRRSKPRAGASARAAAGAREGPRGARSRHAQAGRRLARANSRLSVARLELERLRRDAEKLAPNSASATAPPVEEKEQLRGEREAGARSRARGNWRSWKPRRPRIGEEHAATRAELAGLEERARAANAPPWDASKQQFRETRHAPRRNSPREIERLGVRARAPAGRQHRARPQRARCWPSRSPTLEARVERAGRAGSRQCAKRWPRSTKTLKALRVDAQAAQEKRSQIEVDLVRKQAELKYLDETSRKELNCRVEELAAGRRAGARCRRASPKPSRQYQRGARAHRSARAGESAGAGGIPGSAAAPRFPERAAPGPDRFHPRHRKGHPGDRRKFRARNSRRPSRPSTPTSARSFQTLFGGGTGEMRLTDEDQPGRIGHRHRRFASRQAAAKRAAALGRREGAGRGGAADGHLPLPAEPVLHPGRGGRAARRSQHRAPHAPAARRCRTRRSSS